MTKNEKSIDFEKYAYYIRVLGIEVNDICEWLKDIQLFHRLSASVST